MLVCGAAGYRIKRGYEDYETIDLGKPEHQSLHTIRFPVPVRTVRVTKTVAVPVPVPFPIRHDIPIAVHVPKPIPVPVPYAVQQHEGGAVPVQSAPLGFLLYGGRALGDSYPGSTGSTGATIGHNQGSIGVVVGASYGVSAPAGSEGTYPGSVVNEPVGHQAADSSGSAGYSVNKSVETGDGASNSLQNIAEDSKGK